MDHSAAKGIARDLRLLFAVGAAGDVSDAELLERFIASREDTVFAVIVQRHGPMVWGVCRRILRDHHDAEEAFQATFLVLARKAATISPRSMLPRWLYGVACRTAMKARSDRARRQAREAQVPDAPEPVAGGPRERDDGAWLDQELLRLPEKFRVPIILCDLQGKSHREAAKQLGWPIGTVSGRVAQGRAMLARRMSRGDLSGPLFALASADMPMRLVEPLIQAAKSFAAGKVGAAGAVPAAVYELAEGVSRMMLWSRIKTLVAVALIGIALADGGASLAYQTLAAQDTPEPKQPIEPAQNLIARAELPQPVKPIDEPRSSYPFSLNPDDVRELPDLAIEYRDLHLKAGPVAVMPIATDQGMTGVVVVGQGTFRFTPARGTKIEGEFRAVVLRFNPEEQAAILPLDKGTKVRDLGMQEMSRQLFQVAVRHCWQSGRNGRQEVMIPPRGALAAVLYSKQHGDLLISADAKTATVYNFTDRKSLYEKK